MDDKGLLLTVSGLRANLDYSDSAPPHRGALRHRIHLRRLPRERRRERRKVIKRQRYRALGAWGASRYFPFGQDLRTTGR